MWVRDLGLMSIEDNTCTFLSQIICVTMTIV